MAIAKTPSLKDSNQVAIFQ